MLCLDSARLSVQNSQRLDELDAAIDELERAAVTRGLTVALITVILLVVVLVLRKAGLLPVRLADLLPSRA